MEDDPWGDPRARSQRMFCSFSFLTAKPFPPPRVCVSGRFFSQVPISSRHLETQEMVLSKFKVVKIKSWILSVFWRYCSQSSLTSSPGCFTGATCVCGRAAGLNSCENESRGGGYVFSSLKPLKSKTGMKKLFLLNFLCLLTLWTWGKNITTKTVFWIPICRVRQMHLLGHSLIIRNVQSYCLLPLQDWITLEVKENYSFQSLFGIFCLSFFLYFFLNNTL